MKKALLLCLLLALPLALLLSCRRGPRRRGKVRNNPPGSNWEKLGSRWVKFRSERDVIPVTAAKGAYRRVKIQVTDGDLEMYKIRIHFANGKVFSPQTRLKFFQGERSRTIDLPGGKRVIRKIVFFYRSKLRKGRARVTMYGRH